LRGLAVVRPARDNPTLSHTLSFTLSSLSPFDKVFDEVENAARLRKSLLLLKQQRRELRQISTPNAKTVLAGKLDPFVLHSLGIEPIAKSLVGREQTILFSARYP